MIRSVIKTTSWILILMSCFSLAFADTDNSAVGNATDSSAIDKILAEVANQDGQQTKESTQEQKQQQRQAMVTKQVKQAQKGMTSPEQLNSMANNMQIYSGDEKTMSNSAFKNIIRSTTPMTPDQIRVLRRMLDKSRRATAEPPGVPPKATSSTVLVNMSPGAAPPVIRLRNGYVTSVVFVDATGAPWPIRAYDLGNPKLFNIHWDQKGNTLMIQANSDYLQGNLAVLMRGLNTPIMITLIPGQQAVDYRLDMRIPRLGPKATIETAAALPNTADPRLLDVLDGIAPTGSKALQLSMAGSQAWLDGDMMFLRTPLSLLSPSWVSTVRSNDGMHAYELRPSPVLLVMQRGKITKLTVKGL